MATTQENMDNLMKAAQMKLDAQKKIAQQENPEEDIYADMRAEMENTEDTPMIKSFPDYSYEPQIKYAEETYEEEYTIDPNDTPIFESGPGLSQIELWKKKYEKEKIFHTQILEKHFVFRTLNRFEYKQIVAIENVDALYREEIICSTCVLWPFNYNFKTMAKEDSGYPSTLAQIIMESSGFTKEYGLEIL